MSPKLRLIGTLEEQGVLTFSEAGVPSVADSSSATSKWLSKRIYDALGITTHQAKLKGQEAGKRFEQAVGDFVEDVFPRLKSVRCGKFEISRKRKVSDFDQYEHLQKIVELASLPENEELRIAFGMDYIIQPDVVISRSPENIADQVDAVLLDLATEAERTSLFARNWVKPTLHASVSCKLTLRSDRAQNARSEALNLVRNRKGKLPHIAIVTAEPSAGRISSLALGTGDIDCVYHVALPQLIEATEAYVGTTARGRGRNEAVRANQLLRTLVDGRRLKDIADLPFDLAI